MAKEKFNRSEYWHDDKDNCFVIIIAKKADI